VSSKILDFSVNLFRVCFVYLRIVFYIFRNTVVLLQERRRNAGMTFGNYLSVQIYILYINFIFAGTIRGIRETQMRRFSPWARMAVVTDLKVAIPTAAVVAGWWRQRLRRAAGTRKRHARERWGRWPHGRRGKIVGEGMEDLHRRPWDMIAQGWPTDSEPSPSEGNHR